jgi:hypothetical protein
MKSIDKINKLIKYKSGTHCVVDWVAGGNFDGYLYELSLCFISDTEVVYEKKIIDDRHADDKPKGFSMNGKYYSSDKAAFICEFPATKMRCVIVGDTNEYIVASVTYEGFRGNGKDLVFNVSSEMFFDQMNA